MLLIIQCHKPLLSFYNCIEQYVEKTTCSFANFMQTKDRLQRVCNLQMIGSANFKLSSLDFKLFLQNAPKIEDLMQF